MKSQIELDLERAQREISALVCAPIGSTEKKQTVIHQHGVAATYVCDSTSLEGGSLYELEH